MVDASKIDLALSQGALDAAEVPWMPMISGKFCEVAKHISMIDLVYNAGANMASKKTMDKLPPNLRTAVQEAAPTTSPGRRKTIAGKTHNAVTFLKTQGCSISEVDKAAYAKASQPVRTKDKPIVGADSVNAIQQQTGRA